MQLPNQLPTKSRMPLPYFGLYLFMCMKGVSAVTHLQSSHAELMMMESRKTNLLGRAESLKRSGTELPGNFHCKIHNLTHTWRQLEVTHTHAHKHTVESSFR